MYFRKKLEQLIKNNKIGIVFLSVLASAINYGFQVFLGRELSVDAYGNFNYEIAFVSNSYSFFAPLSILVCRVTSENGRTLRVNKLIYRDAMIVAFIISTVSLAVIPYYRSFITKKGVLDGDVSIWLIEGLIICTGFSMLVMGVVQGLARFWQYGFFNVTLTASKFVIILFLDKSVTGALLSYIYSDLLIIVIILIYLLHLSNHENVENIEYKRISISSIIQLYGGVFIVQLLNQMYINSGEMIIMRHFFADDVLGVYSVASQLCRVGVYATSVIATILLTEIAYKDNQNDKKLLELLQNSCAVSAIIAILYSVCLIFFREEFVVVIYGKKYIYATELIWRMLPFSIGIAMIPIINSFFIGINKLWIVILLYGIGAGVAIGGTALKNDSINDLVVLYGIIVIVIVAIGYIAGYLHIKYRGEENK